MNNLTLGLAVLGGLVLAGVVAHSAWTQRRNAPRVAQPDAQEASGLPANGQGKEPVLDAQGVPIIDLDLELGGGDESNVIHLGEPRIANAHPALDALIDAIASIAVDAVVMGETALGALPATRRVGSKAFSIEGLNLAGVWEIPRAGQQYSAFQAGVQLASRTGALNDIEFSEFVQKAQAFADALGAIAQFPEMRDEISRGRELDQFASSHDAQLGFTLRAKNVAWSTGYVQQYAARQGFVAGAYAGRMVLAASTPGLPPILVLNFDTRAALSDEPEQSALRSLDLALDVPQVDRREQPYLRMRDVAIALAASMDGLITDHESRVISRDAMDAIGADLERLYDTLDAHDLSAGSIQARRLFS